VRLWELEVYARLIYIDHIEPLVELISALHSGVVARYNNSLTCYGIFTYRPLTVVAGKWLFL
jgi:hypothetical protein